jgi:hypothetical protein
MRIKKFFNERGEKRVDSKNGCALYWDKRDPFLKEELCSSSFG